MNRSCFFLFFLIFGQLSHAESEWRTFTSPDGERTFEGRLLAFNAKTATVTVFNRHGQTLHFDQHLISEEDRKYVQATAKTLPPDISLDVRFEQLKERGETIREARVRKKTYDAGYKIILNSYTPKHFSDVEVEYLLIYRKDDVTESGTNRVVRGQASTSLPANRTQEVETQTVELVNFYERGKVTSSGCSSCPSARTNVTQSRRSRDFLVGCIARVMVNGHVVETTATAPNILREYEDHFDSKSESEDYDR